MKEQLRLAWADGLATNAEELESTIPTAKDEENAAPFYRRMRGAASGFQRTELVDLDLIFNPIPKSVADAEAHLTTNRAVLDLADQAIRLPICWFKRNWRPGAALWFPESMDMRAAARLVALRGSRAAHRGDAVEAIRNANEMFAIARHVEFEPFRMNGQETVYRLGVRELAFWAYTHPDQPVYRDALRRALDSFPRPDLKAERRGDLFILLSVLDLSESQEGLRSLGFKADDMPPPVAYLPALVIGKTSARLTFIKQERARRAAIDLPPAQREAVFDDVTEKERRASYAFPAIRQMFSIEDGGLFQSDELNDREVNWKAGIAEYEFLLKLLSLPQAPRSGTAEGIVSPYDGTPLTFSFDGRRLAIAVGRGSARDYRRLFIPPASYQPGFARTPLRYTY